MAVFGADAGDTTAFGANRRVNLSRGGDAHVLTAVSGRDVSDAGTAVYRFVPGQIGEERIEERIDFSLL